eukprot:6947657-Lingulodinium_polyedra.AAC.1
MQCGPAGFSGRATQDGAGQHARPQEPSVLSFFFWSGESMSARMGASSERRPPTQSTSQDNS